MLCMVCGGEMTLMKVAEDETMSVSGFAHHTFMCSVCYDIERRLVFNKHSNEGDAVPTPVLTAPPISPASSIPNQSTAAPGVLQRMLARIHR
jgi:hypothetical protein